MLINLQKLKNKNEKWKYINKFIQIFEDEKVYYKIFEYK